MTLETFLEHLAATKATRKWRTERAFVDDVLSRLRTSAPSIGAAPGVCDCPVTAVAHHLGLRRDYNRPYTPGLYRQAAVALGLGGKLADMIAAAADGHVRGDERAEALRVRLFEAVGIDAPAAGVIV